MNTQQVMEERLWEYIDGMAEATEQSAIEQLIESNIEWRKKYHELLDVHQLMSSSLELDEPSMRFAQNVMEEIALHKVVPSAQLFINKRIIWSIAAFFILSITGFLVYGLAQVSFTGGESVKSPRSTEVINEYASRINGFEFGRIFSSTYTNICFMILVVLGLFLLDMFLNKKKKALRERLQH